MRRRSAFLRPSALAAASLGTILAAAAATDKPVPRNPFQPAGGAAAPVAAAASETIEFAGISQIGRTTHLVFHDKSVKKSRWVGIGETVEGITVVRYDPRTELATVKIDGREKTLSLRKGTGPVNSPIAPPPPAAPSFATPLPAVVPGTDPATAALPAPPAPLPVDPNSTPLPDVGLPKPAPLPGTPEAQVKAETDARMLVSDLLEIGMAQRRAYEEAQRKAAQPQPGQPQPSQP